MIKFRNPSSNIETQISIIKVLDAVFYKKVFTLDDLAWAVTNENLMTAYGYSGSTARDLSNVKDSSRNSTNMNAKMTAEVFRYLGWLSSWKDDTAYPVVVTELGHYVANSSVPLDLYEQCLLGVCNPQEMMSGVRYNEEVRFFVCALRCLQALGGTMYKHELCMGPMDTNDITDADFEAMVDQLKSIRGSYDSYQDSWKQFCANQGMKSNSVDNQTRFPVAALSGVKWVEKIKSTCVYPPKKLQCIRLTDKGKQRLSETVNCKDLRLAEFNEQDYETQNSLIRLGFYEMLQRAGYDLAPVESSLAKDYERTSVVTAGKALLFSPFQMLKCSRVLEALSIDKSSFAVFKDATSAGRRNQQRAFTTPLALISGTNSYVDKSNAIVNEIREKVNKLHEEGLTTNQIVSKLFDAELHSNQDRFYPLVGAAFRLIGFDCKVSRQGDNGSRWDAIIIGPGNAVPIEIKSPGEEEHISIKAVRQAAENKVMLLSRETYPTSREAVSLVVGYKAPNERAEVSNLISAFENTFEIRIGVISFDILMNLVVSSVLHGMVLSPSDLEKLRGFADVA